MSNIRLRALEPADIDIIYRWENNQEYWHIGNMHQPLSKYFLAKYLEIAHLDIYENKQLRLMITTEDNQPIGTVELFDFDPYHSRAGIGIIINDKTERKKGYAHKALALIEQFAYEQAGIKVVYANVEIDNSASIHLFEKNNYNLVGTKKSWNRKADGSRTDELLFQKILG